MRLNVLIQPNSKDNQVVSWQDNQLKLKIKATPINGKANNELINFLSSLLSIPKSSIKIVKGANNRKKLLEIEGLKSIPSSLFLE